ncbi:MAG: nuclease [Terracidiphilus sp.]
MPIQTAIWKVSPNPEPLTPSTLAKEQLLEDMIVVAPSMLSDEWMLIGRQEDTGYGGRIDLLAIAPDGSLVLIELKRDQTPREVVAQSLDYASWVQGLRSDDIAAIYGRFLPEHSLSRDFQLRFGQALDEEALNLNHQIIIVAGSLDESTERIVAYLSDRDIPINVLCFQIFNCGAEQLLSRVWLLDPVRTQINVAASEKSKEPWNGEFYCSFGDEKARSWQEAVRYGFISGGGGSWYSKTLQLLNPGDRVWVKVPGRGFVGVGRVTGRVQRAADFKVTTPQGDVSVLDVIDSASYHLSYVDDQEKTEYFVPVRWLQTVPLDSAIQEIGMFGNQNTVCKPTTPKWRATVERLKEKFPKFDQE